MKVLMALSGGVDSSVAAAELLGDGHEVVGITMRLWGGSSDTGCCSVADVDDARRVAQQLGIDHLVFNFTDDFDEHVVGPYVSAHQQGLTPNPCIECNRHLKFHRLSDRADLLGFDAVATGHHARIVQHGGVRFVARGADMAKDQSYVVHMLPQRELARTLFPIGHLAKAEVRRRATELGALVQLPLHRRPLGAIDALEMVTLGQRRGIGLPGGGPKRYVVDIDHASATVMVGEEALLLCDSLVVHQLSWAHQPVAGEVLVQSSAHGATAPATASCVGDTVQLRWQQPQRRVSPGQSVVLYDPTDTYVLGGGIAG